MLWWSMVACSFKAHFCNIFVYKIESINKYSQAQYDD